MHRECVTAHPVVWGAGAVFGLALLILLLMPGFRFRRGDIEFRANAPRLSSRIKSFLYPVMVVLCILSFLIAVPAFAWYQAHPETTAESMLDLFDQQRSDQECRYRPGDNVLVPGQKAPVFSGFLQCIHAETVSLRTVRRPLRYFFTLPSDIPSGSKIIELRGDFFIDKAGGVRQKQARVSWDIIYGRTPICTVLVGWNQRRRCSVEAPVSIKPGGTLEIAERVRAKTPGESRPLYAGLFRPVLVLEKPC